MNIKDLLEVGLDEKESAIFVAMLSLGPSGISAIARESKQNRVTTYAVINRLIEKKLIYLSVVGKKKVYTANSPENLKSLINKELEKISSILPALIAIENKKTIKPKIRYFEGVTGIKQAYIATANSTEKIVQSFVGAEQLNIRNDIMKKFWAEEYVPLLKKYNKFEKLIIPDNKVGREMKADDKISFRETRFISSSQYNFECEILAVDDTITLISYSYEEAFALSLQSKPIANTIKMIFKIVWSQGY